MNESNECTLTFLAVAVIKASCVFQSVGGWYVILVQILSFCDCFTAPDLRMRHPVIYPDTQWPSLPRCDKYLWQLTQPLVNVSFRQGNVCTREDASADFVSDVGL